MSPWSPTKLPQGPRLINSKYKSVVCIITSHDDLSGGGIPQNVGFHFGIKVANCWYGKQPLNSVETRTTWPCHTSKFSQKCHFCMVVSRN